MCTLHTDAKLHQNPRAKQALFLVCRLLSLITSQKPLPALPGRGFYLLKKRVAYASFLRVQTNAAAAATEITPSTAIPTEESPVSGILPARSRSELLSALGGSLGLFLHRSDRVELRDQLSKLVVLKALRIPSDVKITSRQFRQERPGAYP